MNLEIISLETDGKGASTQPGLVNWKLNDILLSPSFTAAVILPNVSAHNQPMMEFLADWTRRFTKAKKQLYVVSGSLKKDSFLKNTIDELGLNFAPSVDAIRKQGPLPILQPMARTGGSVDTMPVGSIVKTSAEYACLACGKSRMWLKGDAAAACDNLECSNAQAGWKMTYELF